MSRRVKLMGGLNFFLALMFAVALSIPSSSIADVANPGTGCCRCDGEQTAFCCPDGGPGGCTCESDWCKEKSDCSCPIE